VEKPELLKSSVRHSQHSGILTTKLLVLETCSIDDWGLIVNEDTCRVRLSTDCDENIFPAPLTSDLESTVLRVVDGNDNELSVAEWDNDDAEEYLGSVILNAKLTTLEIEAYTPTGLVIELQVTHDGAVRVNHESGILGILLKAFDSRIKVIIL